MIERHGRVTAGAIGDSIAGATGANGGRVWPESVKAGMRKARLADQRARIEQLGGAEAILARPDFNFTPLTP